MERTIKVGTASVKVDAEEDIAKVVEEQADRAGYNTFWVFMEDEKTGDREEVREEDIKGKTVSDVETGKKLVIEKYDEGGPRGLTTR